MGVAGTHGGKFALVNGVPTLGKWSITDAQTLAKAVTSNSAFGTIKRPGVEEWSGQYENHALSPTYMPGDSFAFQGYEAPDNDAYGVGELYAGNVMVKQVAIDWNWQAADIIKITTDFDGDLGLIASAAQAPPLDGSTPYVPSVLLAKWQYSTDGGSTFTTWGNITTANLTFMNAVQEYVNSSCVVAGPPVRIWKGRRSGPWDMTAAVVEENVDRVRFVKGQQLVLKCFIDATNFFLIKYVLVRDFTGISVDRSTGAIISQTVGLDFNAADVTAGTLGQVLLPGGATWWPLAQS